MFTIERKGEEYRKLAYDNLNCVGCGICVETCPTSSLRLGPLVPIARGLIEMDLISVSDSCVFCGLCSIACPFDSLSLTIDGEDVKNIDSYPSWDVQSEIDDEDCIYCGRCKSICPRDSILFERKLPDISSLVRGEISFDEDKCIYCSFCADLCPAEAIELKNIASSSVDKLNNSISVDTSKCVYCGVCKRICPEDAIMEVCSTCMLREEIEVPEISGEAFIIEDSCVNCSWCSEICQVCKGDSCHACLDVCPCNAVEIVDGKSVTNLDFCNLCGACVTACPQDIRILTRTAMNLININSDSWAEILNSLVSGK